MSETNLKTQESLNLGYLIMMSVFKETLMFRAEDIQARLRERPFRPLRFIASEGLRYDIYHPDLVFVGQRDLMIGYATPDRPTVYDQVIRVALVHLVGIEDFPASEGITNGPA